MKKIIALALVSSFIITSLTGCGSDNSSNSNTSSNTENVVNNSSNSNNNSENTSTQTNTVSPDVSQISASDLFTDRDYSTDFNDNDYSKIDLTNSSSDSSNVTIENKVFTITAEGTYLVTGEISEGQIIIDVSDTEKVQLMLDEATITNSTTAPIYVKQADKVFITTASGSTNKINATIVEDETATTNIDGAIFSHDDITLNGEGTLNINVTNGNGIVGKDDLKITSGTYNITADKHGIEANNSIRIADGTFVIEAEKDGMHCEYEEDTAKGYIYVLNGKFNINVEGDGLDASSYIELVAGDYNITTGGGWANAPVKVATQNNNQGGGMMRRAITTTPIVSGISVVTNDLIFNGMMGGQQGGQPGELDEDLIISMLKDDPDRLYAMVTMFTGMTTAELTELSQDEIITLVLKLLEEDPQVPMGGQQGEMPQGGMMPGGQQGEMPQDGMMPGGQQGEMPQDGMMQGGQQGEMPQGGMMPGGQQGEMPEEMMANREPMMGQTQIPNQTTATEEDEVSRKAIKAGNNITIQSGTFNIDSYDDAFHANGSLLVRGGEYTVGTSDDAFHADFNTTIEGGKITIVNCHEGIEGQSIDIRGGYIDITCNDDGLNSASSEGGDIYINIEGGEIYINGILECDGFDSNGNLYMSGGYVQISGTTENRDTVLDYEKTGYITGGTFIATGSASQTIQNFGDQSTQGSIVVVLSSFQSGKVTLTDSKGNVLVDITPPKEYQAVTISSPDIVVGETYTLVSGDITTEIEMTSLLYGSGNQSGGRR